MDEGWMKDEGWMTRSNRWLFLLYLNQQFLFAKKGVL
jgi:hypothetical protein